MIFSKFEPVVEPRMNVRLLPNYGFYKVVGVEPIGRFVKDFAKTITAGSISEANEFEEVYMNENEFAQWRVWVLDDIEVRLNLIGRKETRGTTRYEVPTAYSFSMYTNDDDGQSQFFTFEDEKVYIDIKNPTQNTITRQRLELMGYRYTLEKITTVPDKYTDIPIGKI
jgi:hypothetical protein